VRIALGTACPEVSAACNPQPRRVPPISPPPSNLQGLATHRPRTASKRAKDKFCRRRVPVAEKQTLASFLRTRSNVPASGPKPRPGNIRAPCARSARCRWACCSDNRPAFSIASMRRS
jgi:hypothetical protein